MGEAMVIKDVAKNKKTKSGTKISISNHHASDKPHWL